MKNFVKIGGRGSSKMKMAMAHINYENIKKEEEKLIKMGEENRRQRREYHLESFLKIKEYNHDLPLHKYCLNNRVQPSDYDWLCNEIDKKIKKGDL